VLESALDIARLRGRIVDLDSHLMIPPRRFREAFGNVGKVAGPVAGVLGGKDGRRGEVEPAPDTIWTVKGLNAPGGARADTRLQTLDLMGIRQQLVFPDVLSAFMAWGKERWSPAAMRAHNDYALDWASDSGGRLCPVGLLNVRDLGVAVEEAARIAGRGTRAVVIPDGTPPGGMSPAHPDVDRLWRTLEEAGVAVLLHVGGQHGFTSATWEQTPLLRTKVRNLGSEGDPIGPHTLATMHLSPVNYLSTLIFGGVLERQPTLKVGVMELGAMWIGPMAELLDNRMMFSRRLSSTLSLRPSEYVSRNIRVTAFWQEPVGWIIDRYGLGDVVCFASDFPHAEGGTAPMDQTLASLSGQSSEVAEAFFVTNARGILDPI
jgi:predicted TIM-barrel fold metal-dependent hydrolase